MSESGFVAKFGAGAVVTTDFVVLHCCAEATFSALGDWFWDGDASKVSNDQVFADTYGMTDEDMVPFTIEVNARLNNCLDEHGRRHVVLPTGAGRTVPAAATVSQYVGAIYYQAMAQNP